MGTKQAKAYEVYLTFCIDLGRKLGSFLEELEQMKISATSDESEKVDISVYYTRASAPHDTIRQEIEEVAHSKKEPKLSVVPKKR